MHLGRPVARRNHTFIHLPTFIREGGLRNGKWIVLAHLGGGEKAPVCSPGLITPRVLMMHLLVIERVSGWKCRRDPCLYRS